MRPILKIPRLLLTRVLDDLERPHPFAAERLGFISFRQSMHGEAPLLLCYDYHSIPDEQYIVDDTCGARIGGDAIRAAMGRAYRDSTGQLWVHTHYRCGRPTASRTDRREGPKVVKSLANAQGQHLHGWVVLSENGVCGQVRMLDGQLQELSDISVIGWPMVIPFRSSRASKKRSAFGWRRSAASFNERFDRQSFLGSQSQSIFENAKIGIIGLGGGGSHINQQLAHIGFQHVVLCDEDRAESTNLNRLIGATLQDVREKRFKTKIAGDLYRGLQPDAVIDDVPGRWEEKRNALHDCDIIFGCLDSFVGRRDLEVFCRSRMIPLIDIGMKVLRPEGTPPNICGQTIVSMPGELCMQCLQFLTEKNLAEETQDYNAGPQPQVVWPNGVLASSAVGYAVALLTGWSGAPFPACRLDYRGNQMTINAAPLAVTLQSSKCKHFPLSMLGDPRFRKL